MILLIEAYGNQILRKKCDNVALEDTELSSLIEHMWETMNEANGCGLAAPQIGKAVKLFIVNTKSTYKVYSPNERTDSFEKNDKSITETFINAKITKHSSKK